MLCLLLNNMQQKIQQKLLLLAKKTYFVGKFRLTKKHFWE